MSAAASPARPRVVIVGGGFGGLEAARALRRAAADVLLVDRCNHHLFQPLLYQVATAALSPGNIASPIRRILRRQRNTDVFMAEVSGIDVESETLTIMGRRYAYDYLVVATGARTNYFGHDDWARYAPGLKTVDEAIDVRARFLLAFEQAEMEADPETRRAALTFAIVGAGPTGVEMAGAMAEMSRKTLRRDFRHFDTTDARVILIEGADRVLGTFPEELSARSHRDLEGLGVEIMLGTTVTDVDEGGVTVTSAGHTERIAARNVIWAAGVRASPLGAMLGGEVNGGGRVIVGDDLCVPGRRNVFVVGDLAHRIDPRSGAEVPGVAQGAMQMGRFAGRTIAAEIAARAAGRPDPPRGVFVYGDRGSMATIGRGRAVADVKGLRFGGFPAFALWALIHILFLIEFRNRFMTMAHWIWMYLFHDRGVRLITGVYRVPRPVKPPPDPRLDDPAS